MTHGAPALCQECRPRTSLKLAILYVDDVAVILVVVLETVIVVLAIVTVVDAVIVVVELATVKVNVAVLRVRVAVWL